MGHPLHAIMLDIKARQIACLTRLLKRCGSQEGKEGTGRRPLGSADNETTSYKVLILDAFGRHLVAPLLKVNQLRALGVTLHLAIEAERQPIQEVPAVYLVQGTAENVEAIVKDLSADLYGQYDLSFISRISRPLLESLAQGTVKANALQKIARIEDQYMSFISLEKGLFSLGLPDAYTKLNDPSIKDTEIEAIVEQIVDALFCVFVTLGAIPILKCPPGGAAEHICSALDDRIRTTLKTRQNVFAETTSGLLSSLSRPLMIVFDRNFDLSGALQHSWSYKPLVQDLLHLNLNRVRVEETSANAESSAGSTSTHYDVDEEDFFWEKCGAYSFPKIAEEVETQLQNYKKAVEEINQKTVHQPAQASLSEEGPIETQNLMAAVSSLPELTEKKKVLDKHTSIATALLNIIKDRLLDQYFNLEEDMVSGKADFASMMKLLEGPQGSMQDKLRLACVYLLSANPLPPEQEHQSILQALGSAGMACEVFSYIRTLCVNQLAGSTLQSSAGLSKVVHSTSEGNLLSWAEKNFSQGISSVSKSVKNLLSGAKRSPVVAAVEAVMEGKPESGSGVDKFCTFDPKAPSGKPADVTLTSKEAVVFMVGGGNYLERESLELWATSQSKAKQIIYGSTEMISAEAFIEQLAALAKKQRS